MEELIEELKKISQGMFFESPATLEQIEDFEKENNVKLPEDYREWLLFSNGGEILAPGGYSFYGVPPIKCSLAYINREEEREKDMPSDLYVIGTFCFGDSLCFDIETNEVVEWNHETGEVSAAWDNFYEFLKDMIKLEQE